MGPITSSHMRMQNRKAGRIRNTRFTTYLIAFRFVLSDLASRNPLMMKKVNTPYSPRLLCAPRTLIKGSSFSEPVAIKKECENITANAPIRRRPSNPAKCPGSWVACLCGGGSEDPLLREEVQCHNFREPM